MHKQLTIPALNTRRDVFVEWPLGKNLAEAEEMAALAKEMGVRTAVGLQARQAPSVQKVWDISLHKLRTYMAEANAIFVLLQAKEIIASGALGRITSTSLVVYDSAFNTLPEKAMIFTDLSNGDPFTSLVNPFIFLTVSNSSFPSHT